MSGVWALRRLVAGAVLAGCGGAALATSESGQVERPTGGAALYEYHCATCHGEGSRRPGTAALQLKYQGSVPALLTERTDLTPPVVRYFVRNGVNAMPFFRPTEITDAELEEIAAFLSHRD